MRLLPELSEHFGLGHHDLMRIISTAPARYKVYEIDKRNGGKRTIAHPSRELKEIQRYILAVTSDRVLECEHAFRKIVGESKRPKLTFNDKKRGLYHKGQRRMVTGLVITPKMEVSIGRERKRRVSSLLHRSSLGQLDVVDRGLLKGLLGFSLSVEPAFVERMRTKYGNDIVDAALKFHVPTRGTQ